MHNIICNNIIYNVLYSIDFIAYVIKYITYNDYINLHILVQRPKMQEAWTIWQISLAGTNILYVGGKKDSSSKSQKHPIGWDLVTSNAKEGRYYRNLVT